MPGPKVLLPAQATTPAELVAVQSGVLQGHDVYSSYCRHLKSQHAPKANYGRLLHIA